MKKLPGFLFSDVITFGRFDALISETQWTALVRQSFPPDDPTLQERYGSWSAARPPKERLMVMMAEGASEEDRNAVLNGLRVYFRSDLTQGFDVQKLVAQTSGAVALLNLFLLVVSVISMVLCFFILWLSFSSNVQENAWEFGVLRAVGLTTVQVP